MIAQEYEVNGKWHRTNGPAVEWEYGRWDWWLFGNWHRYYGPADNAGTWAIHGRTRLNDSNKTD
jgi:hypothetical protein